MSLTREGIAGMLREYEDDCQTGMDVDEMAERLYDETSGYPFLVSKLSQLMDEKVSKDKEGKAVAWTLDGFKAAERMLLSEKNTLFESLIGKVINYPELNKMLQEHIFNGKGTAYVASNQVIDLATMFGIVKNVISMDEMRSLEICGAALQDKKSDPY